MMGLLGMTGAMARRRVVVGGERPGGRREHDGRCRERDEHR
jgi:hypothetical protein